MSGEQQQQAPGGAKKRFNKKKGVTFHLVGRSPFDKEAGKPGSSKHVLRPARNTSLENLPKDFPTQLIETRAANAFDVASGDGGDDDEDDPMLAQMKAHYKSMLAAHQGSSSSSSSAAAAGMDGYDDDYDDLDDEDDEGDGGFEEAAEDSEFQMAAVLAQQAAQSKVKVRPEDINPEDWDTGADLDRFLRPVGKDEGQVYDADNADEAFVTIRQKDALPEDEDRLFGQALPSREEIDRRFREAVVGVAPPDELLHDPEYQRILASDDDAEDMVGELDDLFVIKAMEYQLPAAGEAGGAQRQPKQQLMKRSAAVVSFDQGDAGEGKGPEDDNGDDLDAAQDAEDEEERIAQMVLRSLRSGAANGSMGGDFEIEESYDEGDEGDYFEGDEGDEGDVGEEDPADEDAMLRRLLAKEYRDEMIGGLSDEDLRVEDGEALLTRDQMRERGLVDDDFQLVQDSARALDQAFTAATAGAASAGFVLRQGQKERSRIEQQLFDEAEAAENRQRQRQAARAAEEAEKQQREYEEALRTTKELLRRQMEADLAKEEAAAADTDEDDADEGGVSDEESAAGTGFLGLQKDPEGETRRRQRARERARRDRLVERDRRLNEEIDKHMARMFPRRERSQWDGESILSTLSNLSNHPRVLGSEAGRDGMPMLTLRQLRQQQKQLQRRRRLHEEQERQQERQARLDQLTARGAALEAERGLEPDWEHYEKEDFGRGQRVSPRVAGHDHWKQHLVQGKLKKAMAAAAARKHQQLAIPATDAAPAVGPVELGKKGMPVGVIQQHAEERRRVQEARKREQAQLRMQQQRMMSGRHVADHDMVSVRSGLVSASRAPTTAGPTHGPALLQMPIPAVGVVNEADEVVEESPEHLDWRKRMILEERRQREQLRQQLASEGVPLPHPEAAAAADGPGPEDESLLDEFDGNEGPAGSDLEPEDLDGEGDSEEEESEPVNQGQARKRNETKEERKLRKEASKRTKQEQRERKRNNKHEFRTITRRQQAIEINNKRHNIGFAIP